jgi:hypothetical protein
VFQDTDTAILSSKPSKERGKGTGGIVLDNVRFENVKSAVKDNKGSVLLKGDVGSVDTWALGPLYFKPRERDVALGVSFKTPRPSVLVGNANNQLPKPIYLESPKPQYEHVPSTEFVQMKMFAKGTLISLTSRI